MRKIFALHISLFTAFCLNAAEVPEKSEEYMATVEVLYTMRSGDTTTILVGNEELTFQGVHLELKEVGLNTAVAQYASQYSKLSALLGLNTDLTKTVRTQVLSQWADVTSRTLIDGLAKQDVLNLEYADSLSDEVYSQNQKYSALKTEQNKLQKTATQLNAAVGSVSSTLSSLSEQMTQLQESQSAELTRVNEQLRSLAQTSEQNKTDAMRAQEQSLKEYAAKLAIIEQSAGKARTTSQMTLAKISALEAKVESLVSNGIYTKCWQDVSSWLGWYSVKSETNSGVFLPPPKFDTKDTTDGNYYKVENGQSIFTQLSDAGIVPTLTDDGVTSWTSLAGEKPKVYLKKGDEKKDGMTVEGDKKDDFLPIKDWVDGTTITINDEGKYTTDANVGATIEAFLNKHKSSGIKGELKGAAAKKTDDNLWCTNNVANPANPSFDKSDRNNIWNLLAYCGDSDASFKYYPTDFENQSHSIVFLGDYVSDWGNAFSLYGFYRAPYGSCPVTRPASGGNKEGRALEWDMVLEPGYESNTPDMKVTDDSNKPQVVEAVKMYESEKETSAMRRILSLKGFDTAKVGQVAYKKSETELGWLDVAGSTSASAFGYVVQTNGVSARVSFTVNNQYFFSGNKFSGEGSSTTLTLTSRSYVVAKFDTTGTSPKCISVFSASSIPSNETGVVYIPLYYVNCDMGTLYGVLDLRTAPRIQAWE